MLVIDLLPSGDFSSIVFTVAVGIQVEPSAVLFQPALGHCAAVGDISVVHPGVREHNAVICKEIALVLDRLPARHHFPVILAAVIARVQIVPFPVLLKPSGLHGSVLPEIILPSVDIDPARLHNAVRAKVIPFALVLFPGVSSGVSVLQIRPESPFGIDPGYPASCFRAFDCLIESIRQSAVALQIIHINLVPAQIRHDCVRGERCAEKPCAKEILGIGDGRGKIVFRIEIGLLSFAAADHNIIRLQFVKHGLGIGASIAVMTCNNNIHRAKVLADRL